MPISQALLPEFDHEMENTRRTLERVPLQNPDWKPHVKSPTIAWLATHVAQIPVWATMTMQTESLDLAGPFEPPKTPQSTPDLLTFFEKNRDAAREAISRAGDEEFMKTWTLLKGPVTILSMPRVAVLRGFVMNHLIHHRAQLIVYLRMNDVPVPGLYGPSADES
jgi:uncharacterized damage-inducible protein DinB